MNFKLNLSNRISLGYLFIIVVAVVSTIFCIISLRANQKIDAQIQNINLPLFQNLKDLHVALGNSQKLVNTWVFQPTPPEKEKLKELHSNEIPAIHKKLEEIIQAAGRENNLELQSALVMSSEILKLEAGVMNTLSVDSLYSNDVIVDGAIDILEKQIKPKVTEASDLLNTILKQQESNIDEAQKAKSRSYLILMILLGIMILLFIAAAVAAYYYSKKSIVQPIIQLKDVIIEIGQGKVVQSAFETREDEIGEMTQAITSLMNGINTKSDFAIEIGKGNYNKDFQLISQEDAMGKALLEMRKNLKENAEEERKRNWATQGLAEIGTLLRQQTASADELYNNIIRFVVKYTDCNQGGLFLLNTEDKNNHFLSLVACYAYERKKFLEKKVNIGEGLIGQCVLEKETIYLLDIPKDYVQITSGLGEATPSAVLIVPLKINDEIHGVMELASFHKFEKYQIEFIEKLAENIGSAISTVRINERTKLLLLSSQQQTEELRAQEEEVRQNMEEMQATQEEVERKAQELSKQTAEMAGLLEGINSTMATIEFTPNGTIITANENFLQTMQYSLSEIKGKHHSMFVPEEIQQSKEYKTFWSKLASGEPNMNVFKRVDAQGNIVWLNAIYNPIKNENGEVVKVVKFATDITAQQEMASENKGLMEGIDTTMATIEFKPDGTIVTANSNFLNTMKYDLAAIKGKHHKMFVPKDLVNTTAYEKFWADLAEGKPNTGVFQRITSSGEMVSLNAIYNPIKNANGKVIKVIKFATVTTGATENSKLAVAG